MKHATLLLLVLLSPLTAFAGPGDPVIDEKLFKALRDRYNGEWRGTMTGDVTGETLKDGSILIGTNDRFAEFAFYNIPKAKEEFLYVPSDGVGGWLNYFDRIGASIRCGSWSYDLKQNPFPEFTCRFTVDAQGNVRAFTDRSATTSNGKPYTDDGRAISDGWEADTLDFHWRRLRDIQGTGNAYSENQVRDGTLTGESFHFQIFGDLAQSLYAKLDTKVETLDWGPDNQVSIKYGHQIWCLQSPDGKSAKCRVAFGFDGVAKAPSR